MLSALRRWLHDHRPAARVVDQGPTAQMQAVARWQERIANELATLRAERDLYQRRRAQAERER